LRARFELYWYKNAGAEYRFRIKSGTRDIITTSVGYATKAAAVKGIESVQWIVPTAPIIDLT
jgi:uncharacterized protein YegP (UPF0339 family)